MRRARFARSPLLGKSRRRRTCEGRAVAGVHGMWRRGGKGRTWRHVEERICKHTSYPRGSSSRVAVNPGTLILMRLRHVPGRAATLDASRSFTSQKAREFGGVYNAKCIQNLGLFTIPRHPPTRSFSSLARVPLSRHFSPTAQTTLGYSALRRDTLRERVSACILRGIS